MKSTLFAFVCSLLLAAAAATASRRLVLYTSQPDRIAAQTVAAFQAVDHSVHVRIFRSGTTEVINKLAAEFLAGRPQPDVLLIADAMSMRLLKDDRRLFPDRAVDVSAFPCALFDPDHT